MAVSLHEALFYDDFLSKELCLVDDLFRSTMGSFQLHKEVIRQLKKVRARNVAEQVRKELEVVVRVRTASAP